MDYTLKDLLDLPQLRTLLDSWAAVQSIPCVILDLEGNLLAGSAPPDAGAAPRRPGSQAPAAAAPDAAPFIRRLPGGLVQAALPIVVAGRRLGTVCTEPLFLAPPDPVETTGQPRRQGCAEADCLSAPAEVPVVPEPLLRRNLEFVALLVQSLAQKGGGAPREAAGATDLREGEDIFHSLFEKTIDPLLILNCGRFVDCNAATLRLLGYGSKLELLERCPFEISPPLQPDGRPSRDKAEEMIATALRVGHHRFEWLHLRADGSELPVEVTLTPVTVGGELMLHTLWRDITERKQIEGELLRSEAKFRTLYDTTGEAVMLLNRRGFFDCNDATLKMFGCRSLEQFINSHPADLSPPLQPCGTPSQLLADRMIAEAIRRGSRRFEWVHRRTDTGEDFPTEVQLSTLVLDGETVIQGTARDITERKLAEERVLDAMNYVQTILSTSPVGIETFKATGQTVSANEAACRIIGATAEQAMQLDFRSIEAWRRFGLLEVAELALATGVQRQGDFYVETSFGERVNLACQFVPFWFGGEQHLMFAMMDISERKQAEEKLLYSVSLIDAVLESTPDAILVVDLDGKIARWNRKFIDLWNIPEELIAAYDDGPVLAHVLVQMAHPAEFSAKVGELYRHPEHSSEDLLALVDGRLIERYSQPLRIGAEIAGRFWSFRDATERRRSEEEVRRQLEQRVSERTQSLEEVNCELLAINCELEQRRAEAEETSKKMRQLSSAVENSSASIVITDSLGRIEYVNPKFTRVTGYPPQEAIGRNPRLLKAEGQPAGPYRELWETISCGRDWSGDLCNRRRNGEIFWEHASISPIRGAGGEITNFVAVKEDITEQKRIVGELLAAQEAALAASRAKSEFLANMSHEIRTPLSAIIGFSDLTLRTDLQPRQREYLQKILTAGDLLLNIINDILDFSKIEARQLVMEQIPFRLDTVLSNVADIVREKARQKGLELAVEAAPDVTPELVGDQHRLSQVIVNLLSNAVKFTEAGRVALRVAQLQRLPGRARLQFTVRDTGIGISGEQAGKLFQPFTQADGSTTRRFGGTGLGLSISKQLVELMDGEIWCESEAGRGSSFVFTAWFGSSEPAGAGEAARPAGPGAELPEGAPDFSGTRVLLVEDNAVNLELASAILEATGTTLQTAENGRDAVALVTGGEQRFDLVLMDLQMPVLDGYQAARLIRADGRFPGLPIIAMTAHAMTEVQQAVLEAGMDATITKPINPRAFLRVMHSFLRPAAGAGEPGPAPGARAPLPASGGGGGAGLDRDLVGPILDRLLDYVKGRSGRAERYLEGYQRELAGLPAGDLAQVAAKLKDFDFPAARGAILSLARRHDIQLSAGHTGGEP